VKNVEETKLTSREKLWGVIVNPVPTFKSIGQDPEILTPALIILALNVLLAWLIMPETVAYTESVIKGSNQAMNTQTLKTTITWTKVTVMAAAAVMPPLIWLVQAGLLAVLNQLMVGEARFKQLYAVSFFAWLPPFLGGTLKSLLVKVMGMKGAIAIRTGMALFLPSSVDSGFWYVLLSKMDFFVIWGLVLLSLGGAAVMNKDGKKTGVFVFAVWLVFIAMVAFLASKFGKTPGI